MINTILYGVSSKGKIKQWSATSDFSISTKGIEIIVTWGYYGDEFKKQTKAIFVTSGKNKGKSNETSIEEQTRLKIDQLYTEQFDKGYTIDLASLSPSEGLTDYTVPRKPQLAHKFKDKKHLIKTNPDGTLISNYFVQPKLNGTRCFATKLNDTLIMYSSRSGKLFKEFSHFTKVLLPLMEVGDTLDGEIFNPAIPFENIQSLVNSDSVAYTVVDENDVILWKVSDLQYHIYDFIKVGTNKPFSERYADLLSIDVDNVHIHKVETTVCTMFAEFAEHFNHYVGLGYEGLMLRSSTGLYKFGYRTSDLIKYKEMLQDEFLILNIYLADNDPTKVQILCKNKFNDDGAYNVFDVGSVLGNKQANLIKYYENRDQLINKAYLTVDYQALSEYSVPLFAVGVDLRSGSIVDNEFIPEV